ncbi:RNAse P Rpr2/Rpp21 subunit domain-containing protein [Cryptosporidium muris RN66]|uniref:RNAse P Rpr2/Rpp21 subunit domain-containing protein n=1 Tax=Cryptosporidium muris (strain RN66) TaxID=441375 RepID=B6ADF0_CRYMR|nr:RNAse P Rpr2/Rpp21 subunit domain-containing protein [Cryptosporidium muris RN66]EEA06241.1 RNAse P Rpr2/Rpp21 subunit domain-containing protein [Cryptosporidium muris RN66]|eukprot:XP_002140590.1 RNAse P Rpr2/Rpp21 subunit domain-containing protein [Cryptosporidium muris RN66]
MDYLSPKIQKLAEKLNNNNRYVKPIEVTKKRDKEESISDNTDKVNNMHITYLVNIIKLYCNISSSLTSRFVCLLLDRIEEIKDTKLYKNFFLKKVCRRCYSVFLPGINSNFKINPINNKLNRKLKKKIIRDMNYEDDNVKFNRKCIKKISILCKNCNKRNMLFVNLKNTSRSNICKSESNELMSSKKYLNNRYKSNKSVEGTTLKRVLSIKKQDKYKTQNSDKFDVKLVQLDETQTPEVKKPRLNRRFFQNFSSNGASDFNPINDKESLTQTEYIKASEGSSFYDILAKLE